MEKPNKPLLFFFELAKLQAVSSRKFDCRLGGLGFNELMILYHISSSPGDKMRRTDLAERIGLTASGVTRILLPMEKIGLIKREADESDARVSYVALAPGGRKKLAEGLERAEIFLEELVSPALAKKLEKLVDIFKEIS